MFISEREQKNKDWNLNSLDYNAQQNLLGFFDLLLKIDKRNHPELYASKTKIIGQGDKTY